MRNAMRQRFGLSRACAGDDQQRAAELAIGQPDPLLDCGTLSIVQFFQMRRIHPRLPVST